MNSNAQADDSPECRCPRCGNPSMPSMADLRDVVSSPSSEFSSDMTSWLSPPQRPSRPVSRRHRTGIRNSIAFGVVWTIVCTVASFALTGRAPAIGFEITIVAVALFVGIRTWRAESKLAAKEDKLLLATHLERYRAYLHRRRVWSRLRYCAPCGLVVDPVTRDTNSLFHVHELANSAVKGASLL